MLAHDPPRLTIVLDGLLRIEGWTNELKAKSAAAAFDLQHDEAGFLCIRFDVQPERLRENQSAIRAFNFLVAEGVAFARNFKQLDPPAWSARYLQEAGLIEGQILACGFDGTVWHVEPFVEDQPERRRTDRHDG